MADNQTNKRNGDTISRHDQERGILRGHDISNVVENLENGKSNHECQHFFEITFWDTQRFGEQQTKIKVLKREFTQMYSLLRCKHCGREKMYLYVMK